MSKIGIVVLIIMVLVVGVVMVPTPDTSNAQDPAIQTYTSSDGSFSFDYPAAWELQENSDGTLSITGVDALSPSGNSIRLDIFPPESGIDPVTNEKDTPEQVVEAFQESGFGESLTFTDIIRTSVGDKSAAFTSAIGSNNPDSATLDFFFIAVDVGGDDLASVLAQTVAGELPIYQATILSITGSFRVVQSEPVDTPTPEAPVATATLSDGSVITTPTVDGGAVASPTLPPDQPPSLVPTQAPSTVTVEVSPVESLTGVYQSADGTFSFNHPINWILNDLGAVIAIQVPDAVDPAQVAANIEISPPQSAYVMDYSGAGSAFGVMESFKANLGQLYTFSDTLVTNVNGKAVAFVTGTSSDTGVPREFMFAIVEVGGNNVSLIYVDAPVGKLNTYQPDAFAVASTMTSSVPPATPIQAPSQPTTVPAQGTPQPTVPGATTAPQPTPVIEQPERGEGRVVLFYSNGTMTIYNSSDTPVVIEGLELVTPDGERRFISRDYGWYFQRVFAPDRCIHIHLTTQPFSAPSFCRRTGTRQLTYIFGDRSHLNFVWHSGFNASGSFLVQRHGETLATCSIAAGECEFQAPITYIAYEQW